MSGRPLPFPFRSLRSRGSHDTQLVDTLPMTVVADVDRPGVRPTLVRSTLLDRLRAASIHLALSGAAGASVLALVLLAWYPSPLAALMGVDAILLIMLGVDVVLGPLFTLLVFDRAKRSLKLDLAVIAALQLAALLYGLHTVHQGRPAFLVMVKDRFEVISPADLTPEARAAARSNPAARGDPMAPRWVAARMPDAADERSKLLFEALTHGRDVQHHPRLYVEYGDAATEALKRALPIARLRELNAGRAHEVDATVAATGRPEASLVYLPLRGPARDGAALLDAADGRVLGLAPLTPW